jgi:hypothetical protein
MSTRYVNPPLHIEVGRDQDGHCPSTEVVLEFDR